MVEKRIFRQSTTLLCIVVNILFVIFASHQTSAAPQAAFEADNHTHSHDDGHRHQHGSSFTATALSGEDGVQNNNIYSGGGNQSAENVRDALPEIECYRCLPRRENDFCKGDRVGEKVDCLTGRCLVLGARNKQTKHVSRLYMCDTHNIAAWAFQMLRTSLELKPNTCEEVDYDKDDTVKLFRQYGMGPSIADLAQIDRNDLDRPGVLADSVDKLEMCTCTTTLCNSPEALRQMSMIKHDGHGGSRSSATRHLSSIMLIGIMALPLNLFFH